MKIKLNRKLVDLDGKELPTSEDGGKTVIPLTLGVVCVEALLRPVAQGEPAESAAQKLDVYELALKMHKKEEVELTPEQVVLVRAKLNVAWPAPLVSAQASKMLDN